MKKYVILLFVITIITILSMPLVWADGVSLPETISIGLKYGVNAPQSAQIISDGFIVTDESGQLLFEYDGHAELTATYNGVVDLSYNGQTIASKQKLTISPKLGNIKLDGNEYRGDIAIAASGDKLTLINDVSIEEYLYGVVPREIGGGAPLEAIKAQAVCARSYTVRFIGRHKADGFDICTSEHCQVYGSVSAETDKATQGVNETAGIIGKYKDTIAELYYFASDGGATESVENVWGSTLHPYLKAVDDPYETDKATKHKWSVTLTKSEINDIFAQYELGEIKDIRINETTEKGTVTELEVIGTKDSKTFTKESCRMAFGGKVYSQAYTITKNYADSSQAPSGIDSKSTYSLPSVIYVMGKDGIISKRIEEVVVASSSGVSKLISDGEVASYTIDGRGYGHLIGMSQWGAIAMAEQGFKYDEILNHYYTGITLENMGD
ncbi:MAG: SpoIID/LytB domain-containing protein [Eubacteriales bacterium]|nr:SpoIID/LytB domain-containing protein [Eubacteriales bacterium]